MVFARSSHWFGPWLWLLTALFAFRVLAQFVQHVAPVSVLPPFAAWHSAALPYPVLLASQIVILALMVRLALRYTQGHARRHPWVGRWLLGIGLAYFGLMLVRLVLGQTVLAGHPWFGQVIPAVFHLVLASFLLSLGAWHRTGRWAGAKP